ncbi:MAG: AAA family ATPase [Candidatus Eisenbacteria bacterium]
MATSRKKNVAKTAKTAKTAKKKGPSKKRVVRGGGPKKGGPGKKASSRKRSGEKTERKEKGDKSAGEEAAGLVHASKRSGLGVDRLCWRCDAETLGFADTSKVKPLRDIMGQDRAMEALRLGIELASPGYNIYVAGMSGTGKMTTVKKILEEIHPRCAMPRDFAYVYNFKNPYNPVLLTFPQGGGNRFARRMGRFLQAAQKELPAILESGPFVERREAMAEAYLKKQKEIFHGFEEELKANGFVLSQITVGPITRPEILIPVGDKAFPYEQLALLVESGQVTLPGGVTLEELGKKDGEFRRRIRQVMKESRRLNAEMVERIEKLERETVSDLIGGYVEDLREHYADDQKITEYLNDLKEHVIVHRDELKTPPQGDGLPEVMRASEPADPYLPYRVNVVLDNSKTKPCPVVLETNPTYNNVFGTIERNVTRWGQAVTDFTKIKAGAMLQADGGYLVLNAADALSEPGLWKTMKRVLTYRELVIQGIEGLLQLSTGGLKPEPITVDVKVIFIGPPQLYYLLHAYDEEFGKIFKVRADFDNEIPLTETSVKQYASFVAFLAEREELMPFTRDAVSRLIEYGVRRAGRRTRVTSRFGEIADVIRESHYQALRRKKKKVGEEDVEEALRARRRRVGLLEDKVRERLKERIVLIDTEGARVGQVNGLAVLTHGGHRFGIPSRITASVGVGKAGIINVEREAKLSGSTHDKGVLILGGYLREVFARNAPLSLTASVCFEQSYGSVDGDSASSTELYAVLSAIAEVPIRQDVAVTGSVNQKGDVQAIGGVNEKVEGFFRLCAERGLTGSQGVLIPESNVEDLMLDADVLAAVERGEFHVWPVGRIEEGIEILTGIEAGVRTADGKWKRGSLYGRVQERLKGLMRKSMPAPRDNPGRRGAKKA